MAFVWGYLRQSVKGHPRGRTVCEHIIVAERALGRYLPKKAVVHHVDHDQKNNAPRNLVICQDQSYHQLLHLRERVLRAGGDPNLHRICCDCKRVTLINLMVKSGSSCKACANAAWNRRYAAKKMSEAAS